jgi:hypothetical protein
MLIKRRSSVKSTILDSSQFRKYVYCALCGIKRVFKGERKLTNKMYAQIISIGGFLSLILYPIFEWKSLISLVIVAITYEFVNMSIYRKEVKCPHCGFDPVWYRKNWRLAKTMVQTKIEWNRNSVKPSKSALTPPQS